MSKQKIKDIKNNGLKKIFAGGQGRSQCKLDNDVFGKQERDMDKTPTAKEVFGQFAEALVSSQGRYAALDNMDIEMILDAAIDQIAQCIPSEDFEEIIQFRLDGYGLE